jgi:tetratricopeptide (TPR) repeat protein
MFGRLLQSLGFRRGEGSDRSLERYERLSQENRDTVRDTYLRENFSHDPSEQLVQNALRLWREGQRLEALEVFSRAIKQTPENSILLLNRANLNVELGNFNEALSDFERARTGQPRLPEQVFAMQEALQSMSPATLEILVQKRKNAH